MVSSVQKSVTAAPFLVPADEDRFGKYKILGISHVAFKVALQDSAEVSIDELTLDEKGGPARHVHLYQDEWFYVTQGEFILEVGDQRYHLRMGDSVWGPKQIPHVWANVTEGRGKMIVLLTPAGKMDQFFIDADTTKQLPGQDQNQWRPYGMEWVGPPLKID